MSQILVVLSDNEFRQQLVSILQENSLDVEVEETCEGAINRIKNQSDPFNVHDVVITEIALPDKSGMELIRHIDDNEVDSLVIVITANGNYHDVVECIKRQETVKDWFNVNDNIDKIMEKILNCCNLLPFIFRN